VVAGRDNRRTKPALHEPSLALADECFHHSLRLLRGNSEEHGIIACAPSPKASDRNYASIFGRDAAICSMGMAVSGDPYLQAAARRSLVTLARYQAGNGQIPKFVKPEVNDRDFWYVGCIDATIWWLLALHFLDRTLPGAGAGRELADQVDRALNWLCCQEHQGLFLLQQNEASDWADIMPRSGFVLYSNALWAILKDLYGLPGRRKTRENLRNLLLPFGPAVSRDRRIRVMTHFIRRGMGASNFFLSFVNLAFWGPELDVFGNILALLAGLLPASEAARRVDEMIALGVNRPHPVRVLHRPIRRNSRLWRGYMERHLQNLPYQYHNGGVWPFVGGFWVLLLVRQRRFRLAREELARLAAVNSLDDWGFNEWLHGKTGRPAGMRGQSWNAAMYLLASRAVEEKTCLFPETSPRTGVKQGGSAAGKDFPAIGSTERRSSGRR